MSNKLDLLAELPGLSIIHQKIPAHEVGRHEHDEHEIFLPLQGDISIHYGNQTVKAGPGRMLYVPPNFDHSFTSSAEGAGERVILLVKPGLWKKHAKTTFEPLTIPVNALAKELIFYLLIHQDAKGLNYFVSALIEALVGSLESGSSEKLNLSLQHLSGRVKDKRVKKALDLMETPESTLQVSEIADSSGMSPRNFNRLFLLETGLNPKEYLIYRRLEKAKQLLKSSPLTVTDIALEVGYNSLSKFIQAFKRTEGVLPSDYRSKARGF